MAVKTVRVVIAPRGTLYHDGRALYSGAAVEVSPAAARSLADAGVAFPAEPIKQPAKKPRRRRAARDAEPLKPLDV